MITNLDDPRSLDPVRVGAKAAWLARGQRAGLPILPGVIIEGAASTHHMRLGAEELARRGSGGARMAITSEPLAFEDELKSRASALGPRLVARSSSTLEGSGEWSGAFSSILDLSVEELPRGVVGCWASAFSVAALERQNRAGIEPGSVRMSVLVQPLLSPRAGGICRIGPDRAVTVIGVRGSPAPLLQGWVTGQQAAFPHGSQVPGGNELGDVLDEPTLAMVVENMRQAADSVGAGRCEWAVVDDEVWLLQLGAAVPMQSQVPESRDGRLGDPTLVRIARLVTRFPGALGEAWVLPWALGGLPTVEPVRAVQPGEALAEAKVLSAQLAGEVWGGSPAASIEAAHECFRTLRGPEPWEAIGEVNLLRPPDRSRAGRLLSLVEMVRSAMVAAGAVPDLESAWYLTVADVEEVIGGREHRMASRMGVGRWEPFVGAVVTANGTHHRGTSAAPGLGAGRLLQVEAWDPSCTYRSREVVTGKRPTQTLAPLLWDASALVTATGSPAAHLFESARALGVPAVCGLDLSDQGDCVVAVDGDLGLVSALSLFGEEEDD